MKITVIVVLYNGKNWIEKCFGSLRKSSIPLSVMAIDNASMDDTVERIKADYPEVELIESQTNLGFGKANNIGLKKAIQENFDYVFLLNQDAWVEAETLEKLIKINELYPKYGVLSPIHFNGNGTALDHQFVRYLNVQNTNSIVSDFFVGELINASLEKEEVYETNFVNAAGWLISNSCLRKVGGFNPIFPHYGEDEDYINRVRYHNFKIGIVPIKGLWHDRYEKAFDLNFERRLKRILISLLNINSEDKEVLSQLNQVSNQNLKLAGRNLIRLNGNKVKFHVKLAGTVKKNRKEIIKSREISKFQELPFLQ